MNIKFSIKDKYIIFGAGDAGLEVAKRINCDYFVDNSLEKQGEVIYELPVKSPSVIHEEQKGSFFVIIASYNYSTEIAEQLEKMGLRVNKEFADFRECGVEEIKKYKYMCFESTQKCNSRCIMCDCWKRKAQKELTIDEFDKIMSNYVFSELEIVNFSGGEPLMLPDIIPYLRLFIRRLPKLKSISINCNGLLVEKTINQISEFSKICAEHGIDFVCSISIDGVYEIHDKHRGIPGAFDKSMKCLIELNNRGVGVQVCTTITNDNIWGLEELTAYLNKYHFSRTIMRLYRNTKRFAYENEVQFLSFDKDELYQCKLLLWKLFFKGIEHQKMISMLSLGYLNGKNRVDICTCPYINQEIAYVDCTGKMLFCCKMFRSFVTADMTSSNPNSSLAANASYYNSWFLRDTICHDCLDEYCISWTPQAKDELDRISYWNDFFTLSRYYSDEKNITPFLSEFRSRSKVVLITGWYGTETVGDKAILAQIISEIRERDESTRILITSVYPFITERTLYELNEENVEIIPLFDSKALEWASSADEVIMGGGPLMEMEWLAIPLWLFSIAKQSGKKTVIRGCGIGPVFNELAEKAVCDILQLADEITLRDKASMDWATERVGRNDIRVTEDPAVPYIRGKYKRTDNTVKNNELACFLRELTMEYESERTEDEFIKYRTRFEEALARNIKQLCDEEGLVPHFYSMHNFVIGNDDRDFYYRFAGEYFEKGTYVVDNKLTSIEKVTNAMNNAALCLCMRFHSVAFADTLDVPYIAIDYTNGWKIKAFLDEQGKSDKLVSLDDLIKSDYYLPYGRVK